MNLVKKDLTSIDQLKLNEVVKETGIWRYFCPYNRNRRFGHLNFVDEKLKTNAMSKQLSLSKGMESRKKKEKRKPGRPRKN